MDRHACHNAAFRVDGYWNTPIGILPSNEDLLAEFERAKAECVRNMERTLHETKSLTFGEFVQECREHHWHPEIFRKGSHQRHIADAEARGEAPN